MKADTPLRVFLAGEGANELGSRSGHPVYQSDEQPGVIEALLRRVRPDGWIIAGARNWKSIRKLKVGGADHADTRCVLGAALDASEAECNVLAFTRDRDNDSRRPAAIEAGITHITTLLTKPPDVIGGVAVPLLEGWILALGGRVRTEAMSPTAAVRALEADGIPAKGTRAMVAVIESGSLDRIPGDAKSLRQWLERAKCVLAEGDP